MTGGVILDGAVLCTKFLLLVEAAEVPLFVHCFLHIGDS